MLRTSFFRTLAILASLQGMTMAACAQPIRVEVVPADGGFELRRAGEPFFIQGAGGTSRMDQLAAAGANAVRTWDAEGIGPMLDRAHELGLAVAVGIWLEHERHGFDMDDPGQRQAQLDRVRTLVMEHKDHPAVLLWGVGNEVELEADMDQAFGFVEEAAAIVQALDANHPTMGVIAEIGGGKARRMQELCPSIDIIGINSYAGLASIPDRLSEQGVTKPYIVTEFGPPGPWEVGSTEWGAPFEPSSAEKARVYEQNYRGGVLRERGKRCLGSFVFLWGNKQEATGTWFGMFLKSGEATPTVDTMTELWSGKPPANRAPVVEGIRLLPDGLEFTPGQRVRAAVGVRDADGDGLEFTWELRAESTDRRTGGDDEDIPDEVGTEFDGDRRVEFSMPARPGAYRLFVVARDGNGGAGTANLPIRVNAD